MLVYYEHREQVMYDMTEPDRDPRQDFLEEVERDVMTARAAEVDPILRDAFEEMVFTNQRLRSDIRSGASVPQDTWLNAVSYLDASVRPHMLNNMIVSGDVFVMMPDGNKYVLGLNRHEVTFHGFQVLSGTVETGGAAQVLTIEETTPHIYPCISLDLDLLFPDMKEKIGLDPSEQSDGRVMAYILDETPDIDSQAYVRERSRATIDTYIPEFRALIDALLLAVPDDDCGDFFVSHLGDIRLIVPSRLDVVCEQFRVAVSNYIDSHDVVDNRMPYCFNITRPNDPEASDYIIGFVRDVRPQIAYNKLEPTADVYLEVVIEQLLDWKPNGEEAELVIAAPLICDIRSIRGLTRQLFADVGDVQEQSDE